MQSPPVPPVPPNPKKLNIGLLIVGILLFGLGMYILWHATRSTYVKTGELLPAGGFGFVGLLLCSGVLAKRFNKWVGGAVFLVVTGGLMAYVVTSIFIADSIAEERTARFDMFRTFIPFCEGESAEDTADYTPGDGIAPTVILAFRGSDAHGEWQASVNQMPEEWLPESREETQLVACVKSEKDVVQRCSYRTRDGGFKSVEHVQYHQITTLYEASTRKVLLEHRQSGDMPSTKCAGSISMSSSREVTRGSPHISQAHDVMRPFVTGEKAKKKTKKKRTKKAKKRKKNKRSTAPSTGWDEAPKSKPSPTPSKASDDEDDGWGF